MIGNQTILLVENSESDRLLMQGAILRAQFTTSLQTVVDGEAAIAYLKGEGVYRDRTIHPLPFVMLLDLNLPRVSGFDVLAWVRSQPKLKRIPMIILSASSRAADIERAYDLGATGFLVKPATLTELVTITLRLRDWLEINHFPPRE